MRAVLALFALIFILGCGSGTLSREDYLAQSNAIARDFEKYQTEVNTKLLPNLTGLSRIAARQALADDLSAQADHDDQFGKRMAALIPPPDLADHKVAYLNLLGGLGPKVRVWANAVRSGNRGKEEAAGSDLDRFLFSSMDSIIVMHEKHGEDASAMKRQRADLAAELGQKRPG